MRLSIITINFNNYAGLRKTLASVASQTCTEFEHVIIDGGSNDGSKEIIEEYAANAKYAVKWVSEKDNGIYNGMNKGIQMALDEGQTQYIQILNSGDSLYANNVVESMYNALKANNYPAIMYGNMVRDNGDKHIVDYKGYKKEWTMLDFINGTINHDPTYIRSDIYKKYGLYDENLKICSDWKWFVSAVIFGGEKPVYVPINVTLFDVTGISETQLDKREAERWAEIKKMLPIGVLRDYEIYTFPMRQVERLKRHHLWKLVYFVERVLFKFEKWHIIKS